MEVKGYFITVRSIYADSLSVDFFSLVIRVFLSSWYKERTSFSWEIYDLLLGRWGKGQELFLHLLFLNCL